MPGAAGSPRPGHEMNILTDRLPDTVRVNGIEVPVRTDFRTWIQVGQLFRDSAGAEAGDVISDLAALVLGDEWPFGLDDGDFVSAVSAFYGGFPRLVGTDSRTKRAETRRPDYDFIADSEFIYSSFVMCYNIRLAETDMHWWEFLTLFDGLMFDEGNAMSFVVGTRQTDIKQVPKTEKRRIGRLKREFALPKSESERALEKTLASRLTTTERG